jgi:hypothetical protein
MANTPPVSFRLPEQTLDDLDALAGWLYRERGGRETVTRTTALIYAAGYTRDKLVGDYAPLNSGRRSGSAS